MARAAHKTDGTLRTDAEAHEEPQPAEGMEGTAVAVVEALITTARAIERLNDARLAQADVPPGLSGPRLRVLLAVDAAGRPRANEVAAAIGVRARTVTTLVDALEKEGLLARHPDPTDRRATLLALTPSAQAQFDRVRAIQRALGEEVVAPLDAAQRRQLLALLTQILGSLRAKTGDPVRGVE